MYPKASAMVEKMGYKGHGHGLEEKGRKEPISPNSYKYNRGLCYSPIPKIIVTSAKPDPPIEVEDSDEEEFH